MLMAMQVFHSYGDKNSELLLQYYGFVEEINVNDYYTADLLQFLKKEGDASTAQIELFESSPYVASLEQVRIGPPQARLPPPQNCNAC